jgi:hypothetical protein
MKKFIIKVVIFSLFLVLIIFVSALVDDVLLRTKFPKNVTTLIIGDSHSECGINDKMYPNSKNISQPGEIYFFCYYKLKKLLKYRKIDTVLVAFSRHSISYFQDEKLFGIDRQLAYQRMYSRNMQCLGFTGIKDLYSKTKLDLGSFMSTMVKGALTPYILRKNGYIGAFRKSNRSNLQDSVIKNRLVSHFYDDDHTLLGFSQYQQVYLNKIFELCNSHNIKLYLVDIPVSPYYEKEIPQKMTDYFDKYIKTSIPKNVEYLDFSNYNYPDSCYGDGDHFNSKGANVYTRQLIERINKPFLYNSRY